MKHLGLLIALAGTLLAVSACVVEPIGGRGGYYGGPGIYIDGGGDRGHHDYGRRVWRE